MKEGIFVVPQIIQLPKDQDFNTQINLAERRVWKSFENICRNFLCDEKVENYCEIVQDLISSYSSVACNKSQKLTFLHSHLDFLPGNMGAIYNEHFKRIHQDISQIEKRCTGKLSPNMLADYYWSVVRWMLTGKNKGQKKTVSG